LDGNTSAYGEDTMIELERANFKKVVGRQSIVLVECWAPGCGVCAQFDPIFAKVATQHPDHTFARMNIVTDEKLGEFFEIEHTPCLMVYRDGLMLLKKPGLFTEDVLNEVVRQVESLDMDMVRADIESSTKQDQTKGEHHDGRTE
jgi:thioredoxin-like negative regulator of GroEL